MTKFKRLYPDGRSEFTDTKLNPDKYQWVTKTSLLIESSSELEYERFEDTVEAHPLMNVYEVKCIIAIMLKTIPEAIFVSFDDDKDIPIISPMMHLEISEINFEEYEGSIMLEHFRFISDIEFHYYKDWIPHLYSLAEKESINEVIEKYIQPKWPSLAQDQIILDQLPFSEFDSKRTHKKLVRLCEFLNPSSIYEFKTREVRNNYILDIPSINLRDLLNKLSTDKEVNEIIYSFSKDDEQYSFIKHKEGINPHEPGHGSREESIVVYANREIAMINSSGQIISNAPEESHVVNVVTNIFNINLQSVLYDNIGVTMLSGISSATFDKTIDELIGVGLCKRLAQTSSHFTIQLNMRYSYNARNAIESIFPTPQYILINRIHIESNLSDGPRIQFLKLDSKEEGKYVWEILIDNIKFIYDLYYTVYFLSKILELNNVPKHSGEGFVDNKSRLQIIDPISFGSYEYKRQKYNWTRMVQGDASNIVVSDDAKENAYVRRNATTGKKQYIYCNKTKEGVNQYVGSIIASPSFCFRKCITSDPRDKKNTNMYREIDCMRLDAYNEKDIIDQAIKIKNSGLRVKPMAKIKPNGYLPPYRLANLPDSIEPYFNEDTYLIRWNIMSYDDIMSILVRELQLPSDTEDPFILASKMGMSLLILSDFAIRGDLASIADERLDNEDAIICIYNKGDFYYPILKKSSIGNYSIRATRFNPGFKSKLKSEINENIMLSRFTPSIIKREYPSAKFVIQDDGIAIFALVDGKIYSTYPTRLIDMKEVKRLSDVTAEMFPTLDEIHEYISKVLKTEIGDPDTAYIEEDDIIIPGGVSEISKVSAYSFEDINLTFLCNGILDEVEDVVVNYIPSLSYLIEKKYNVIEIPDHLLHISQDRRNAIIDYSMRWIVNQFTKKNYEDNYENIENMLRSSKVKISEKDKIPSKGNSIVFVENPLEITQETFDTTITRILHLLPPRRNINTFLSNYNTMIDPYDFSLSFKKGESAALYRQDRRLASLRV